MWCSEGEREWEDLELPVLWRLLSGISPWRLWHRAEQVSYARIKLCNHLCVINGPKITKETIYKMRLCTFFPYLFCLLWISCYICTHTDTTELQLDTLKAPSYLSKTTVLLPKSWQTAQWGDRGVALTATNFSGGLTVDVIVVPVQVVVTSRAEQRTWRGQGARRRTSTVGVGGGLPERHWEERETHLTESTS